MEFQESQKIIANHQRFSLKSKIAIGRDVKSFKDQKKYFKDSKNYFKEQKPL